MDRAGPTQACTPSRRSRISMWARACLPTLCDAGVNDELPTDINILSAVVVPHRFHARHHAVSRRYLYQISRRRTAFAKAYVWWVKEPLDVQRMRLAAQAFVGMRDFRAFTPGTPALMRDEDDERRGSSRRRWCCSNGSRLWRMAI